MADHSDNGEDHDCGVIRPIEEESVQRIVAGQAVTDLATAVKELVDNALDAGSTGINIRLFNQGLDIVEVSDDGSGVPAASRTFLAQAHSTSKIRAFDDIYSTANSLGFRGEALFCLANLSEKLIVATRTEDDPMGQKMEFAHDGTLVKDSVLPVPRKVGTTVAVTRLLSSLPVRRADLERRIVQHRSKLMRMMEGYAIFSVGVRLNLMDIVGGKEKLLLATTANNKKLEQNISSILGTKFLGSVTPISIDLTQALDPSSPKGDWRLEGFVSRAPSDQENNWAKAGQQFFSINGRPVELPKVARAIGDVWRSLGGKKKFSCIVTITLPNQEYDVNLSPEKRQVLLTSEGAVCQAVRAGVAEFWSSQTDGQFTPCASQPAAPAPSPAPSTSTLKPPPPKINDMESLAKIQEKNRKRAREMYAKMPSTVATRNKRDIDAMDIDGQDGGGGGDDDQPASRHAYIQRFKEAQNEQRKLNASHESASCQYGEAHPELQEQQVPQAQSESPRVRRRGGFVHVISTAKQFERPASIDGTFKIPPGIEDPDEDGEGENTAQCAKRQRTNPGASGRMSMKEAAALAASCAIDDEAEQCPSRRVTLSLKNESTDEQASTVGRAATKLMQNQETKISDGDKMIWTEAQSRFNETERATNDIDTLVKTSVSPKLAAFQTPSYRSNPTTSGTNRRQALINLEQFAFNKNRRSTSTVTTETPAVSPGEASNPTARPKENGETREVGRKSSVPTKTSEEVVDNRSARRPTPKETNGSSASATEACDVVWSNFSGTANIVSMAKADRQRMQDQQHKLWAGQSVGTPDSDKTPRKVTQKVSLWKGDFGGMSIVGQFNLGFIVAQSTSGDGRINLWVLDQHACDERYNFERLSQETVMHEQKLIAPMPIELDAWEENIVMAHRNLFKKNGFHFMYSEEKPPRHRLALTALPHSGARDGRKAVTYGKEDVSALCEILAGSDGALGDEDDSHAVSGGTGTDGSGMYGNNAVRRYARSSQLSGDDAGKIIARLPKAIAMFASRACRGSIMIGTALSKKEMEKVVRRMDKLEDPWRCAHGRPTLTHIKEIGSDLLKDEHQVGNHLPGPTVAMTLSQEAGDALDREKS